MSPRNPTARRRQPPLQEHLRTTNAEPVFRKPGLFLVEIGDAFAMVDSSGGRLVLLNAAGAWLWTRLGSDIDVPDDFAAELCQLGVLGDRALGDRVEPMGVEGSTPRVLGVAPLQVAANNSLDPFSGTGW